MDKLELDLDDLEVNSFAAEQDDVQQEGTVHGQEVRDSYYLCCTLIGCPGQF